MKYLKIASITLLTFALFAFKAQNTGGMQGKIMPVAGIQEVMVISGTDTLKVQTNNGSFLLKNLKARTYSVLVKANSPYKDYTLRDIAVIDSATTDIGQIKLLQY